MNLEAWANISDILGEFLLMLPKAGPILRTILGVISIYLSLLSTLISSINRNNGIIIRATFIIVHDIFAR